jgi:hypothetical protein
VTWRPGLLSLHACSPPLRAPRCDAIQCPEHTTTGRTAPDGTRINTVSLVASTGPSRGRSQRSLLVSVGTTLRTDSCRRANEGPAAETPLPLVHPLGSWPRAPRRSPGKEVVAGKKEGPGKEEGNARMPSSRCCSSTSGSMPAPWSSRSMPNRIELRPQGWSPSVPGRFDPEAARAARAGGAG